MSPERCVEQRRIDPAGAKTLAGVDRRHDRLGRAEQHRVDGVEVALERPESFGEGPAIVARAGGRQRLGQRLRLVRGGPVTNRCTRPPKMMASLVRPIAVTKSGCGGGSGAAPRPSTMRASGKCSACSLVQRHFQHARHHLHAAGQALRRRIDDAEAAGATPQSAATSATTAARRRRARSPARARRRRRDRDSPAPQTAFPSAPAPAPDRSPSAKNASLPCPCDRLHPAYWLARQAITGCETGD